MKIALVVWQKRVAPVFDSCQSWLLFEDDNIDNISNQNFKAISAEGKAEEIISNNIDMLICGAIPNRIECFLIESGCKVYSFIAGDSYEVIDALQNNKIRDGKFKMPGCAKRERRDCNKRGKGLINSKNCNGNNFNRRG